MNITEQGPHTSIENGSEDVFSTRYGRHDKSTIEGEGAASSSEGNALELSRKKEIAILAGAGTLFASGLLLQYKLLVKE